MKKILFVFLVSVSFAYSAMGQAAQKLEGTWEGKLNVGKELRIVLHFAALENGLAAKLDSPDQLTFGLTADTVSLIESDPPSVDIKINRIRARFTGQLINDTVIEGNFYQIATLPLVLKKSITPSVLSRAQTPQPPFPYKSVDVEYDNAENTQHFGGTLTIPEGKGPFPAAVLITGSGAQDRNETIADHPLFAVLADALTRAGLMVLRVDDRGIGKSTGEFLDATTEDFARDVQTSLDYLLARPETDRKKTGLIGHSEGGMIAPMVASSRNDVNFIVLLAAPGIKISRLMAEQNEAILRSVFVTELAINAYIPFYKKMVEEIPFISDAEKAYDTAYAQIKRWISTTDLSYVQQMGFVTESIIEQVAKKFSQEFTTRWMRYFLRFDPQSYLENLKKVKVLAINGSRDIQVISASNLAGIEASLKKSKVKDYTVKEIPGLNHLFQTCQACSLAEYYSLSETFSPLALEVIKDWLKKNVMH